MNPPVNLTVKGIEKALRKWRPNIDSSVATWAHDCHTISLAIVQSGVLEHPARVARGTCVGVGSQHSWVVLGEDVYDQDTAILDPTLWSYDATQPVLWWGTLRDRLHHPHGQGNIWSDYGPPPDPVGPIIRLTNESLLSDEAQSFLRLCYGAAGGLDIKGWDHLAHAPVESGWPAAEIIEAMYDTDEVRPLIPMDIVGMVTYRNPGGLYLEGDER